MKWLLLLAAFGLFVPLVANALSGAGHSPEPWYRASMASTGLAPVTPEAVVQVYAAPAFDWRGIVAVHTWIVTKRSGAAGWTRWDVMGWGGAPMVKRNTAAADALWFGKAPVVLLERRGDGVDALIDKVEAAVATYPYNDVYRTWPGPNSNTFIAHVARQVPDLRLDMPANALGKDYSPLSRMVLPAPSGTGVTLTVLGLVGLTVAWQEGIELNLLGLGLGVDVANGRLRLPGMGRWP
ncbi:MAG: DUF3750 domain-containing protein [Solirubrobacterales bacterium]